VPLLPEKVRVLTGWLHHAWANLPRFGLCKYHGLGCTFSLSPLLEGAMALDALLRHGAREVGARTDASYGANNRRTGKNRVAIGVESWIWAAVQVWFNGTEADCWARKMARILQGGVETLQQQDWS
jgi:hypothetical protein